MIRLIFILLGVFLIGLLQAQTPQVLTTQLSLSESNDTLIVKYELMGNMPHLDVRLEVTDSLGNEVEVRSLAGDFGNIIYPEKREYVIYWDMQADGANVYGETLFVLVKADILMYPETPETVMVLSEHKRVICYFPWLLVASGVSAITGSYFWYMANQAYDDYVDSDLTIPAEDYRRDVIDYDNYRNYAFGAAAVFGIAGTWRHLRHREQKRALQISALPAPDGGALVLRYNF